MDLLLLILLKLRIYYYYYYYCTHYIRTFDTVEQKN